MFHVHVVVLSYFLVPVPIAAGIFYPAVRMRLPPELAAFAMAMSSVSVIVSSLSLRWFYRRPVVRDVHVKSDVTSQGEGDKRVPMAMRQDEYSHTGKDTNAEQDGKHL